MYTSILVAVDLDQVDTLTKALHLAARTAQQSGAEVLYVDVVDAVPTIGATTEGERYEARLKAFAEEQARAFDIKARHLVVLRGDLHLNVGPDIVKAAKDAGSDLIVMASHVPGFKDHILSSNAGYVASHAPMTVYVVR